MQVRFNKFKSSLSSWDSLFTEAAAFASTLQPDRLITISHTARHSEGVVVVWYWAESNFSND